MKLKNAVIICTIAICSVFIFGCNQQIETGLTTQGTTEEVVNIAANSRQDIKKVKADSPKNLFVDEYGTYYINSNNDLYEVENNKFVLSDIVRIFGGYGGTFAIDENGDAWGWNCDWLDYTSKPKKIEGLKNVKSVVSGWQRQNESEIGATYSVFLLENGDIYIAGRGIDLSEWNFPNLGNFTYNAPEVFNYKKPTKFIYHGKAKDIWPVEYGEFAILMDNDDLININFKINKENHEASYIAKSVKELMTVNSFNIAITEDGYYGWGIISYNMGNGNEGQKIKVPVKLAGMEPVLTCSNQLVGMKDGSVWFRKNSGDMTPIGKKIQNLNDVIYIKNNTVMLADGTLCSVKGTYDDVHIMEIADTGFYFDYEISEKSYNLNLEDIFWKYGGYTQ